MITAIDGQIIKIPACVILRLLPRPSIVIECENFPANLTQKEKFHITLQNGIHILVHLMQVNMQISNRFRANCTLIPSNSYSTVFDKKNYLQTVQFSILNFPFSFNKVRLEAEDWLVELTAIQNLQHSMEILKINGGYGITHVGLVKKSTGELFSVDDCKHFLCGLEWFLSFVRGTNCTLAFIKGCDQCGGVTWEQWGLGVVDPWLCEDSWLPNVSGNSILSKVFPGFWDQLKNNARNDITRCLDWYSSSNTSDASHVRIVLSQASLEVLCSKIYGGKGCFASKLRSTLKKLNINTKIPLNYCELKKIRENMKYEDGPRILAEIRNDLVHPKSKLGTVSSTAYWEALNLSRWYIEMMLLYKFEYVGEYQNRLTRKIDLVPWD